jgi:ribosomal protein L12E/L44/L45/RPP1/RPP2
MAGLGVKPGDVVSYSLQASDNRDKPEPNVTKSRAFSLTIVSRDQLQRLTEERQQKIREEPRRLIEVQTSERTNTGRYDELLAEKPELEQSERQMLQGSATAQRQIGQRLERLAKEVGDIVGDIGTNRLWDVSVQERLTGMQEKMKAVAGAPCTEAANMLAQAANTGKQAERAESISAAGSKQDGIIAALKELYGQMEEWEDYADITRQVRELLEKHRQVMQAIEGGEDKEEDK